MAVEEIVYSILRVILDWLSVAVVFSLIYVFFMLVTGGDGLGKLGGFFGGDNKRRKRGEDDTDDGGRGNGPEDTSGDYKDWKDGFGTVTVLVSDLDGKGIKGAKVTIKHRKISGMSRKMKSYTGTNGTYGPKRIPAGPIMVKATHRKWYQYAITLGGAAALSASGNPFIGGALALGGLKYLSSDRYAFKEWFALEAGAEELFHVMLKREKGQPRRTFEPKILKVESKDDHTTLTGRID